MKYLITGSSGQLAREFAMQFDRDGIDYVAPPESHLNITDSKQVTEAIEAVRPQVVLNCAAYNDVEKAEVEPAVAYAVNGTAVRHLAAACERYGATLVHYSTDYVFDGTKQGFYTESDPVAPLNEYGRSKLQGEQFALEHDSLVLRVSWVFGPGQKNFLYKLRRWAKTQQVLHVVWDQISVPTYTEDIVTCTLQAVNAGLRGLYHLTNSDYGSRYEVARYFLKAIGCDRLILPVASSHFPSPVRRPYFSAMSNHALAEALHVEFPHWHEAVGRYCQRLAKESAQ